MYPEFVGHPLLKDYPAQKTQPLVEYRSEEEAGLPLEKLAPFRGTRVCRSSAGSRSH
jgi:NADH-quinone oxidoreductase subunit C